MCYSYWISLIHGAASRRWNAASRWSRPLVLCSCQCSWRINSPYGQSDSVHPESREHREVCRRHPLLSVLLDRRPQRVRSRCALACSAWVGGVGGQLMYWSSLHIAACAAGQCRQICQEACACPRVRHFCISKPGCARTHHVLGAHHELVLAVGRPVVAADARP